MASQKQDALLNVTADGKVTKLKLTEGDGDISGRGAKVTVRYTLHLNDDGKEGSKIDSSENRSNGTLTFTQGRKKVIPALDAVVSTMCAGEKCRVTADSSYAFGRRGLKRKGVPPDADVILQVELVSFEGGEKRKEMADMSPMEMFEQAKVCKENGNALFKEVKYEKAMVQYSQCIRYVANVFFKPKKSKAESAATIDKGKEDVAVDVTTVKENGASDESTSQNKGPAANDGTTQNEAIESGSMGNDNGEHAENGASKEGFSEAKVSEEDSEEAIETIDVSTASRSVEREKEQNTTANGMETNGNSQDDAHEPTNIAEPGTEIGEKPAEEKKKEDEAVVLKENEGNVVPDEKHDPNEGEVRTLHVTALNNLSLCLIRMEQYKRAVESASVALEMDSDNSKALYYR